jgi:hypothetical protein
VSAATLLLIFQIVQLVETEVPSAIALVQGLKKSLATDPSVPGALAALNEDTSNEAKAALAKIEKWQSEHSTI